MELTIDRAIEILADLVSDDGGNHEYDRGASQALASALELLGGDGEADALLTLAWARRRRG